jgi:hypothetical protein
MITEEQKNQLEILTRHERYGQLLIDAIKSWEKINPEQETYGVSRWNTHIKSEWQGDINWDGCCLVGASIIGKSNHDAYLEEVMTSFNLKLIECLSLAYGFDGSDKRDDVCNEAYDFGNQVAKILFNDSK